ncbi:guanine nucleotide-binding protein G(I)/G(S)/G(O) subunit gamma-12 isoform X1 [Mauremys reevesii]|uniref:guanine nucleotide-binding protein G(I)/G(S)/G(O) subunit gamma-12 isoform X1 n=1 Tax=Mauremys reevesii TaxID=260615 RepID=UPI0019401492|nr:guanine nucleotide-binding protein G(I)/G(S)/G(O) subunit gamma-12 isoform X1 [Mauremys reevesii]
MVVWAVGDNSLRSLRKMQFSESLEGSMRFYKGPEHSRRHSGYIYNEIEAVTAAYVNHPAPREENVMFRSLHKPRVAVILAYLTPESHKGTERTQLLLVPQGHHH